MTTIAPPWLHDWGRSSPLSNLDYLLGLLLLVATVVPHASLGSRAQRLLPPRGRLLHGLAGAVVALASLIVTAALLGSVGWFRPFHLLVASWLLATVLVLLCDRVEAGTKSSSSDDRPAAGAWPRWVPGASLALAAAVTVRWVAVTTRTLDRGITEIDSNTYHLPFAAQFVRTGWVTRFPHVWPDPVHNFYPANSELLHAIVMTTIRRDALEPLVNLVWLGLLLLAGWCVGVRDRVAPITLLGVAWVASVPLLLATNGGTAVSDLAMLAGLVAAVALWRNADGDIRWMAVSGVAVGLSVGSKLTVGPTALVLVTAMVLMTRSGQRLRTVGVLAGGMALGGSVWFIRNLVRTGTPLPMLDLPLLPSVDLPVVDRHGRTVLDFVGEWDVWRTVFWTGTQQFFGLAGIVLAAALVVSLPRVLWSSDRGVRSLAACVVAGLAGYLVTPAGAWVIDDQPSLLLFTANLRYLLPALVLVVIVGAWGAARRPGRLAVILPGLLTAAVAINVVRSIGLDPPATHIITATGLVAVGSLAVVWGWRHASARAPLVGAVSVAALVGVLTLAGPMATQREIETATTVGPLTPEAVVVSWAVRAHPDRLGIYAFDAQYRLYGPSWGTDVVHLGARVGRAGYRSPATCAELVSSLEDLDVSHAVLGPTSRFDENLDLVGWAMTQPGTTVVFQRSPYTVVQVGPRLDPALCVGVPAPL